MILSKIFSYIFHPVFMPISIFILLISCVDYINYLFSYKVNQIYFILLIFTVLLPICFSLLVMFFFKKSIYMESRKDRLLPYLFASFSFLTGYFFLIKIIILDSLMLNIYLSLSLTFLLSTLITLLWKISLHMISIGSAIAICIYINYVFGDFFWITIYCIIIAGIIGMSRLNLQSHNMSQVSFGFVFGLSVELFLLFNYNLTTLKISTFLSSIASLL